MIMYDLATILSEKIFSGSISSFIINLVLAAILFVIGLLLGGIVKIVIKKILEKAEVGKTTKKSFVNLFLTVIKWSIYLLFASLALDQLGIPWITKWLSSVIVVIPALVGSLILICFGFAVAVYLKDVIEESKVLQWQILSNIVFYFIMYIFLIFALKTALISFDNNTVNIILIIFTSVISASVAFWHVLQAKKK